MAADTDYIYAAFSPSVRENAAGPGEQIQQFIRFIEEDVTGWDFTSGSGCLQRQDGVTTSTRVPFYRFDTDSGVYRCDIGESIKDTAHPDRVAFPISWFTPTNCLGNMRRKSPRSGWTFCAGGRSPGNLTYGHRMWTSSTDICPRCGKCFSICTPTRGCTAAMCGGCWKASIRWIPAFSAFRFFRPCIPGSIRNAKIRMMRKPAPGGARIWVFRSPCNRE